MWSFDPNNQPMYQQYAQAYNTQNYSSIDQNQAMGHMQQFVQNAPPNFQQQVYQQHFEQMPYEQRTQFAQQMLWFANGFVLTGFFMGQWLAGQLMRHI